MSIYSKDDIFFNPFIRKLAGSACATEFALKAVDRGNETRWNMSHLETLLYGRRYPDISGLFDGMFDGRIPQPGAFVRMNRFLDRRVKDANRPTFRADVLRWRDYPLWALLCTNQPGPDCIFAVLTNLRKESLRRRTGFGFARHEPGSMEHFMRFDSPSTKTIKEISQQHHQDALMLLTAWAKEAREARTLRIAANCAQATRSMFPRVV